jgi:hypothetical protein
LRQECLTLKVHICLPDTVDEHGLSMDGKQFLACEVSDNVDLERVDGVMPSQKLSAGWGIM